MGSGCSADYVCPYFPCGSSTLRNTAREMRSGVFNASQSKERDNPSYCILTKHIIICSDSPRTCLSSKISGKDINCVCVCLFFKKKKIWKEIWSTERTWPSMETLNMISWKNSYKLMIKWKVNWKDLRSTTFSNVSNGTDSNTTLYMYLVTCTNDVKITDGVLILPRRDEVSMIIEDYRSKYLGFGARKMFYKLWSFIGITENQIQIIINSDPD